MALFGEKYEVVTPSKEPTKEKELRFTLNQR